MYVIYRVQWIRENGEVINTKNSPFRSYRNSERWADIFRPKNAIGFRIVGKRKI